MIPHLYDIVEGDEEIKIALAESIANLRNHMYLGGLKAELELLKPLESLCMAEEGPVRDKAVESIMKILKS